MFSDGLFDVLNKLYPAAFNDVDFETLYGNKKFKMWVSVIKINNSKIKFSKNADFDHEIYILDVLTTVSFDRIRLRVTNLVFWSMQSIVYLAFMEIRRPIGLPVGNGMRWYIIWGCWLKFKNASMFNSSSFSTVLLK